MNKDSHLLQQGSTETLSRRKFIINRTLPHYTAELLGGRVFYNYYISFLWKLHTKLLVLSK